MILITLTEAGRSQQLWAAAFLWKGILSCVRMHRSIDCSLLLLEIGCDCFQLLSPCLPPLWWTINLNCQPNNTFSAPKLVLSGYFTTARGNYTKTYTHHSFTGYLLHAVPKMQRLWQTQFLTLHEDPECHSPSGDSLLGTGSLTKSPGYKSVEGVVRWQTDKQKGQLSSACLHVYSMVVICISPKSIAGDMVGVCLAEQ